MRAATAARDRVRRKLALQEKEYAAARDRESLRLSGELITANLYRMERGMTCLTAENYYEEGCPQLDIRPGSAADASAERRPLLQAVRQGQDGGAHPDGADGEGSAGVLLSGERGAGTAAGGAGAGLQRHPCRADGGRLSHAGAGAKRAQLAPVPPAHGEFRSTAGLRILVGRSNRQNDRLTCKDADRRDIWFHTQKIHGSHVILCTGGTEPDRRSIEEAASLAAYYSQGREGGKVPVDYTPVKFVKKPAGGKPGMVVYTTYQTIYAVPDEALARRLSVK